MINLLLINSLTAHLPEVNKTTQLLLDLSGRCQTVGQSEEQKCFVIFKLCCALCDVSGSILVLKCGRCLQITSHSSESVSVNTTGGGSK